MKELFYRVAHLITTAAKLLGKGGARSIVVDSLLMKQQLMIIRRRRRRSPRLTPTDQFLLGFWLLFLSPHQINRAPAIIRPSDVVRRILAAH